MKTEIYKSDLLEALKNINLIISKSNRSDGPPVHQVHIKTNDAENKLVLSATNWNENYQESIPCNISSPGSSCIEAKKLFNIVKKSKSDKLEFLASGSSWFHLTAGKLKMKLPETPPDLFPVIDTIKPATELFIIRSEKLQDIFDKTSSFIGDNEARRNLMGLRVFTSEDRDRLRFMGADSYRIADYKITDPILLTEDKIDMIVPAPSLSNMTKIFKGDGELHFFNTSAGSVQVRTENKFYSARLIDAEYPNLDRLLINPPNTSVNNSEDIIDAIEMIWEMGDKDKCGVMKIKINEELTFENQPTEFSGGSVSIDHDYFGDEMVLGVNTFFMGEVLKVFKKEDIINFGFKDMTGPLVLSSPSLDYYKAVLMPVRIQW